MSQRLRQKLGPWRGTVPSLSENITNGNSNLAQQRNARLRIDAIRDHVFAAERVHADDTTVPVLAKGKTRVGRLWTYVRDDRPFAGPDPPAAVFFYSRDRGGEHPEQHLVGCAGPPDGVPDTEEP